METTSFLTSPSRPGVLTTLPELDITERHIEDNESDRVRGPVFVVTGEEYGVLSSEYGETEWVDRGL